MPMVQSSDENFIIGEDKNIFLEEQSSDEEYFEKDESFSESDDIPEWMNRKSKMKLQISRKQRTWNFQIFRKIYSVEKCIKRMAILDYEKKGMENLMLLDSQSNFFYKNAGNKIKYFAVEDMCSVEESVLFVSKSCGIFYEWKDGVISPIRKDTSETGYKKIKMFGNIYLLGKNLTVLDKITYEIIEEIKIPNILDFHQQDDTLFLLTPTHLLTYNKKILISHPQNSRYEKIFCFKNNLFLSAHNTLDMYTLDLQKIKSYRRIKGTVHSMVTVNNLIIFCTEEPNSLRIMEDESISDVIPNSKIKFPKINSMISIKDTVIFSHHCNISSLMIFKK